MGSFEKSTDPVWIVCPILRAVLEANSAALEFVGYPHEEFIGKSLVDLHTAEGAATILQHCAPYDDKPSAVASYRAGIVPLIKKDGLTENIEVYCRFSNSPPPRLFVMARRLRRPFTVPAT